MYNFDQLRRIPMADVLRQYGVVMRKRSDSELVSRCPLRSHRETEHKNDNETFCVSIEKNIGYCHSTPCRQLSGFIKGVSVVDLVCYMDLCDVKTAAKKLSEVYAVGTNGNPPSKSSESVAEYRNPPLAFQLKNLDPDHAFLKEKGITIETAMEFGVGFHAGKGSMSGRVCFPLYENGAVIGYAGRCTDGSEPKWKLPSGLKRTFIYGLERCTASKALHLTESCWGVLWLFQQGLQAAALIGTTLTEEQERLLDPYHDIKICMDYDDAGREAAERLTARLKPNRKVTRAFLRE